MLHRKNYRTINFLMLIKVMGWLVMLESLFMAVPLLVSVCYGEDDWIYLLSTVIITLLAGSAMATQVKPKTEKLGKREGFLLTASVWVVFSLFGMLPFLLCDSQYGLPEAFTEAMSGLTTTGANIIDNVEGLSHGLKMWRSMMQWIGGMGIVLFTLAVIPMLNHSGGMQMFNAEVTGITHGKLLPRISQTAKALWLIYISLTGLCFLMLIIGPMDVFESLTHALSTIATGGFSIYNDGIEHYHSNYVKVVTTVFMFFASINFGLIFAMTQCRFRTMWADQQFRVFLFAIIIISMVLLVSEFMHGCISSWGDSAVDTMFMVVSAFSSTSYTSAGIEYWGDLAIVLLIMMIFVGACAGSTAGGAKIERMIVLVKYLRNEIRHAVQPNAITTVKVSGKIVAAQVVTKVIAFLALYVMVILAGTLLLSTMDIPLHDSLFTSITCISNSGTCINIGTLDGSLAPLPAVGKVAMAIIMLIGRLEIYTVLVLFTSSFWRK